MTTFCSNGGCFFRARLSHKKSYDAFFLSCAVQLFIVQFAPHFLTRPFRVLFPRFLRFRVPNDIITRTAATTTTMVLPDPRGRQFRLVIRCQLSFFVFDALFLSTRRCSRRKRKRPFAVERSQTASSSSSSAVYDDFDDRAL